MTTRVTNPESGKPPREAFYVPLVRNWAWLLLGFATVFFAGLYIPKFYFASMYTETIVLPIFYHDLVELHHSAATWGWGGFSALFPDDTVYFLLNFLFRDGQIALQLLLICFFIGWFSSSIALGVVLKRPHKLALCSLLLLLWVALMDDFGLPSDWSLDIQDALFQPLYHSGSGFLCLTCLTLLLGQISGGVRTAGFWFLFVLTFLGGVSDLLFLVVFAIPALATLTVLTAAYWRQWKNNLGLAVNVIVAGVSSYFLTPYIFPPTLGTSGYIQMNLDRLKQGFFSVLGEMLNPQHHLFFFLVVLDVLTVLGGIAGLLFFIFSRNRKLISPVALSVMIFCSSAVFINWFAVMLTDDYQDTPANRYLTIALLTPLYLGVFGLHAIILWRPWLEKAFATSIAVFTISVSFIPEDPSINYDFTTADIPYLVAVMGHNHIEGCLANYWSANIVTFLSNEQVCPRSLTNDARIYYWFNNLQWFGKGLPPEKWPKFRMLYMPDHGYADRFGKPDRIVYTPGKTEVWLYSDARSIRYNEYFDILSNDLKDEGRTIRFNSSEEQGDTGHIEGTSKVVTDGKDGSGWIEFGPYIVLEPGRYRATFHYTYSKAPTPGNFPTYDLLMHTGDHEKSSDNTTLPFINTQPQTFSDEFTVTENGHQYEMRLFYHGSGSVKVDSLDVTYIGR